MPFSISSFFILSSMKQPTGISLPSQWGWYHWKRRNLMWRHSHWMKLQSFSHTSSLAIMIITWCAFLRGCEPAKLMGCSGGLSILTMASFCYEKRGSVETLNTPKMMEANVKSWCHNLFGKRCCANRRFQGRENLFFAQVKGRHLHIATWPNAFGTQPYQTHHTAATLWLAAGERPEWIARQVGHTSTEMLFRVYSRYVANLTRQDGSAADALLKVFKFGGDDDHHWKHPWYKQMLLEQEFQQQTFELCSELMERLNINPLNKELCGADKVNGYRNNHELVLAWGRNTACCPSCIKPIRVSSLKKGFVCWLLDHDFRFGDVN